MAARILSTMIALLLAGGAYFGMAPAAPGVNLLFVLFLFAAFVLWFEWESIAAGYSYLREREAPRGGSVPFPLIRIGPLLRRKPPPAEPDPEKPPEKKPGSDRRGRS